jgi:type II secretory pathway pseudopilin PulG
MMKRFNNSGFTLIEVTFALLLMTLGLFSIFHLFPSGLRASVDANAYTRQAMFAEDCFASIRARAAKSNEWGNVFSGSLISVQLSDGTSVPMNTGYWSELVYPQGQPSPEYLRCKGTLLEEPLYSMSTNAMLGKVKLEVRYGRIGTLGETFYTELYDYGM